MNASPVISHDYLREQQCLHRDPRYGRASLGYAKLVAALLKIGQCESLTDYGAGKCKLKAGLDRIRARRVRYLPYDPAFPDYGEPQPADLVACIDVLEHIEPARLDAVLDDLVSITTRLGFFTIHTGPAVKTLSDGRNAHMIQEPPSWWAPRLAERFEIIHLQSVPKGFWVLVAAKDREDILASLDLDRLVRAASRYGARRKSLPKRFMGGVRRALGDRR